MTAEAEIILERRRQVLVVPREAVVTRRGKTMVQVAAAGGNQFKSVEVGLADEAHTEILSGLSEGEVVLVAKSQDQKQQGDAQPSTGSGSSSRQGQGGGGPLGFGPPPPM